MITVVNRTQHHLPQTKGEFMNAVRHTDDQLQTPDHTVCPHLYPRSSLFVRVPFF